MPSSAVYTSCYPACAPHHPEQHAQGSKDFERNTREQWRILYDHLDDPRVASCLPEPARRLLEQFAVVYRAVSLGAFEVCHREFVDLLQNASGLDQTEAVGNSRLVAHGISRIVNWAVLVNPVSSPSSDTISAFCSPVVSRSLLRNNERLVRIQSLTVKI